MKTLWITMTLAFIGGATAQDIPPLAPLRGDAATLKDTMKFIQGKLGGTVNYMTYAHDNVAGTDSAPVKRRYQLGNVSADPGRCYISFHGRFDDDWGSVVSDVNYGGKYAHIPDRDGELFLKQIREVTLTQLEQVMQLAEAKIGHPEISVKVDPPIFLVVVRSEPNRSMMFNFYDDTLADRVSKALQHAVDLCGGGNLDPF